MLSTNRSRITAALAVSITAHAGAAWMIGDTLPASAASAPRAVSVSLMPAALSTILNSIPPSAIAAVSPAEIETVVPARVAVVDEPDVVVAARGAEAIEPLVARPVAAREPEKTLRARDRATPRAAAVADAPARDTAEGRPGGGHAAPSQASASGQPGADRRAQPASGNPPPEYPWRARVRGHEGRVVLSIWVRADGGAERLAVAQSSGHAALDRAAVEAVERWTFEPARRSGIDTDSILHLPVIFRLDD